MFYSYFGLCCKPTSNNNAITTLNKMELPEVIG